MVSPVMTQEGIFSTHKSIFVSGQIIYGDFQIQSRIRFAGKQSGRHP